ncbi:hypothetical protein BJ742DRAFT_858766 [Cladochytrium replicatum]|nr:hypothetical protein BJ742DRAFT_858766 [Cladochytrium replicatum]
MLEVIVELAHGIIRGNLDLIETLVECFEAALELKEKRNQAAEKESGEDISEADPSTRPNDTNPRGSRANTTTIMTTMISQERIAKAGFFKISSIFNVLMLCALAPGHLTANWDDTIGPSISPIQDVDSPSPSPSGVIKRKRWTPISITIMISRIYSEIATRKLTARQLPQKRIRFNLNKQLQQHYGFIPATLHTLGHQKGVKESSLDGVGKMIRYILTEMKTAVISTRKTWNRYTADNSHVATTLFGFQKAKTTFKSTVWLINQSSRTPKEVRVLQEAIHEAIGGDKLGIISENEVERLIGKQVSTWKKGSRRTIVE